MFSGRGGRVDYHRSSSYSDDHSGENRPGGFPYYGRGGGAAGGVVVGGGEPWAPDATGANRGGAGGGGGAAYTPTGPPGGPGSRASRDGNWRSPSTPQTDDVPTTPDWGSHWHPPPSPVGRCSVFVHLYVWEEGIISQYSTCLREEREEEKKRERENEIERFMLLQMYHYVCHTCCSRQTTSPGLEG